MLSISPTAVVAEPTAPRAIRGPSLRSGAIVVGVYLLVSSVNQLIMFPFDRAYAPWSYQVPVVILAAPTLVAAAFQIAVCLVVAGCVTGWICYARSADEPLGDFRAVLAVVGWCHWPLLAWAAVSMPLVVVMLRHFDGIVMSPASIAANADALWPIHVIDLLRPWAWLSCLAMFVVVVGRTEGSMRTATAMVLPPIGVLLSVSYVLVRLLLE